MIKSGPLCSLVISSVLKSLYDTEGVSPEEAYMQNIAHQAIQNLVILLKLVYPKLHGDVLPNLEDLLTCFIDFSYVEKLCEELKKDAELVAEHPLLIAYLEESFYKDAKGQADMKRYLNFATAQLDYVLKTSENKNVLCNRHNNINYRKSITDGDVLLLCSRHADFGSIPSKAVARFFLMALLVGFEDNFTLDARVPHFVYLDGFDLYAHPDLSDLFTLSRKCKTGTVVSTQNLASIGPIESKFVQTILVNSPTKLSFGNCTPEDYAWWEKEFGERREWIVNEQYNTADEAYSTSLGSVAWGWKQTLNLAKQQGLADKEVVFKIKDKHGKSKSAFGRVDFLATKYKEPHKSKTYNFSQYVSSRNFSGI